MANVKISGLTTASSLATTDQFEINNAGTSKSVTGQVVADLAASSTNTLTNKTFDTAGTGNTLKINGTTVNAVIGTGSVLLAPSVTGNAGKVLTTDGSTVSWGTASGGGGAGSNIFLAQNFGGF